MKKLIIKAAIISSSINALCLVINLITALTMKTIYLGLASHGGEISEYYGFGIVVQKFYPLTNNPSEGSSTSIGFDLISLLIPLILIFGITLGILIIRDKKRK